MPCPETLRTQAYFDGEVDALAAAEIERHTNSCADCHELLRDLGSARAALRAPASQVRAPALLRARIAQALDQEASGTQNVRQPARRRLPSPLSFWLGAASGLGLSAVAAALLLLVLLPRFSIPLIDDVVDAHIRSLMPDHLIEVPSSDRHTVKPWFAGHADVSPPVADFAPQGYRLVGGRSDYLDHQRAAAVVYQHGAHIINLFSWAASGLKPPASATRRGYHVLCWRTRDIDSCAVSDAGWDELQGFAELVRALSTKDAPPNKAGE
jgi:anti-sigma factor RsiW